VLTPREQLLKDAHRQGWEAASAHDRDAWAVQQRGQFPPIADDAPPSDDPELQVAWVRGWNEYIYSPAGLDYPGHSNVCENPSERCSAGKREDNNPT
jgi:hypothetical protein